MMVRGQFSGLGIWRRGQSATTTCGFRPVRAPGLWLQGLLRAPTTLEKTLAIWPPRVSTITAVMIATRTRTPANMATVRPIASPTPEPLVAEAGAAGSQACPFQRHRRSGETAGFHSA